MLKPELLEKLIALQEEIAASTEDDADAHRVGGILCAIVGAHYGNCLHELAEITYQYSGFKLRQFAGTLPKTVH